MKMVTFKLEKGTVINWKEGLPLQLVQDVEVETSEGNYNSLFNHDMQSSGMRSQATTLVNADMK